MFCDTLCSFKIFGFIRKQPNVCGVNWRKNIDFCDIEELNVKLPVKQDKPRNIQMSIIFTTVVFTQVQHSPLSPSYPQLVNERLAVYLYFLMLRTQIPILPTHRTGNKPVSWYVVVYTVSS